MTSGKHPDVPGPRHEAPGTWRGETYYGRQQLKPWPFDPVVVGAYVFLAGLSGASAIIGVAAALVPATRRHREARRPLVRRARYLSLLAPTIGSGLLIWDLHSPKRFYNMLRVAKARSPMSIGTWTLVGFGGFAGLGAAAQALADLKPRWRWPSRVAAVAQVPTALTGAGLGTYTAALVAATSAPAWAAAPRPTAVRFAASSIASSAAVLSLLERRPATRRSLETLLLAALTGEIAAGAAMEARYKATGIDEGLRGPWRNAERIGATQVGTLLPFALLLAARHLPPSRAEKAAQIASLAAVFGSAAMRISLLGMGAASATKPDVSLRFAQPDNLPTR